MIHLCKSHHHKQEFTEVPCPYHCSGGYNVIQVNELCGKCGGTGRLYVISYGRSVREIKCIGIGCVNGMITTTKQVKCKNPGCVRGLVRIPK